MKNKIVLLIIVLVGFIGFRINVSAASGSGEEFKSYYDKGIQKIEVSGSKIVTIYGKSECNGSTCPKVEYAGQYSNFEDVLKHSIVCTNGEKYIIYQEAGSGKTGLYDSTKSQDGFSGTMYWGEEYQVTCTTNSTGEDVVELEKPTSGNTTGGNTSSSNTGGTGTSGDTTGGSSTGGSTGSDSTGGSGTVDNPQTGVSTYFVVLGLIAIISYVGMVCIKRFNLFKNI